MVFKDLVKRLIEIYKQNSVTIDLKRKNMINKFVFFTEYLFKIGVSAYLFCALPLVIVPIYFYFVEGESVQILPLYFPGINETTLFGYAIHIVLHIIYLFFGWAGSAGSDFFFALLIINVPLMSNILKDNFDELNGMLKEKKIDTWTVRGKLVNIILIYGEMTE